MPHIYTHTRENDNVIVIVTRGNIPNQIKETMLENWSNNCIKISRICIIDKIIKSIGVTMGGIKSQVPILMIYTPLFVIRHADLISFPL